MTTSAPTAAPPSSTPSAPAPSAPDAVTPTLPADAPFAPEQRSYVEGFLAALASVREVHRSQTPPADQGPGAPLAIFYGSQSGNCEALSKQLRKLARNRGFDPEVQPLDQWDPATFPALGHVLILCSTFGEGDPPDNAKNFTAWLLGDDAPPLADLHYAVCALGDRSYTHFCKTGLDLDARLAELGASRLADCVTCDVDYDEDFAAWRDAALSHDSMLAAVEAAGGAVLETTEDDDDADAQVAWTKARPFPATLLRVQPLNGPGSAKEVNHVELSLAGSGLDYEVGDALGLWPINCGTDVQAILDAGGFTGEETVEFKGQPLPLRAALLTRLDLHTLTPVVREALDLPVEDDWLRDRHLIDTLTEFAPAVGPQQMVDALRPLQPRLYSIASSPKAHPGQVQLTVGAVRYDLHGRPRKGVASCYLADRVQPGAAVGVYLQTSAHFRLPEDDHTPIIMVGPGTGIAPFRAFLEERIARRRQSPDQRVGKSWLFFGDQHEASDFLYRDWLNDCLDTGDLDRLDLAWSRDGKDKVYVQHRMLQQGAELFRWLEDGAHFYICGDASRMAKDVDAALHQIVAQHGSMTPEQAAQYVARLGQDHRYQRDVY